MRATRTRTRSGTRRRTEPGAVINERGAHESFQDGTTEHRAVDPRVSRAGTRRRSQPARPAFSVMRIAAQAQSKQEVLETIATSFLFPKHFGKNYDALYDCLTDLVHKAGSQPGFVIVLEALPVAQKFDKEGRETLLDVFREAPSSGPSGGWRSGCFIRLPEPSVARRCSRSAARSRKAGQLAGLCFCARVRKMTGRSLSLPAAPAGGKRRQHGDSRGFGAQHARPEADSVVNPASTIAASSAGENPPSGPISSVTGASGGAPAATRSSRSARGDSRRRNSPSTRGAAVGRATRRDRAAARLREPGCVRIARTPRARAPASAPAAAARVRRRAARRCASAVSGANAATPSSTAFSISQSILSPPAMPCASVTRYGGSASRSLCWSMRATAARFAISTSSALVFAAVAVEKRDRVAGLQAQDVHVTHDVIGQREGFARGERAVYEEAWHVG